MDPMTAKTFTAYAPIERALVDALHIDQLQKLRPAMPRDLRLTAAEISTASTRALEIEIALPANHVFEISIMNMRSNTGRRLELFGNLVTALTVYLEEEAAADGDTSVLLEVCEAPRIYDSYEAWHNRVEPWHSLPPRQFTRIVLTEDGKLPPEVLDE